MAFTDYTRVETGVFAGMIWAVGRVDDWCLWGPAWDSASRTRAIVGGRIALEEAEWKAAERLPYEGGLASRWLLAQWLEHGPAGVARFNGAAVVVIFDEASRSAHIWTDRMGFYPAFASTAHGTIMASHPDVVALGLARAGLDLQVDETTIAEFLRTGGSAHPHTYWKEVRHLDPASAYTISASGSLTFRENYWRPAYLNEVPSLSRSEFVDAFAEALRSAGRKRTLDRLGKAVVLLSSGADSRGVLCSARTPSQVDCFTYFDELNIELDGARKIAELAGAHHFPLQRTRDYYAKHAEQTVALSGGMWSIESGHHAGFAAHIREQAKPGTLLTGCYCDYLFKGLGLNRRHVQLAGRNLPLYKSHSYEHQYYLPYSAIAPAWSARVDERLNTRFPPSLQSALDQRHVEYARLAPLSREGDAAGRLTLWRTLPFDIIVADSDVLDAYGRLSVADKLSGIAFGQAVARVTGQRIANIPNSGYGASVGTGEAGRVSAFLLASAARKVRSAIGPRRQPDPSSVATLGSWPNLSRVALGSSLMHDWFQEIMRPGAPLLEYVHPARQAWSLADFAHQDVFQLYRLITAGLWLRRAERIRGASRGMIVRATVGEGAS